MSDASRAAGTARPKSSSLTPCGVRNTFDGFEIAMNEPAGMDRVERRQHAQHHRARLRRVERAAGEPRAERLAFEQLHGDEDLAVGFIDVVDLADVGVRDGGGSARFTPQPLAARRIRAVRARAS